MKYIITENQYEKLLKASLKRHANDPQRDITGGMFIYNGHLVKYTIFKRDDGAIYATYTYDERKKRVYIMNEETFIQFSKKEQEDSVEFRIKKDIEKKY